MARNTSWDDLACRPFDRVIQQGRTQGQAEGAAAAGSEGYHVGVTTGTEYGMELGFIRGILEAVVEEQQLKMQKQQDADAFAGHRRQQQNEQQAREMSRQNINDSINRAPPSHRVTEKQPSGKEDRVASCLISLRQALHNFPSIDQIFGEHEEQGENRSAESILFCDRIPLDPPSSESTKMKPRSKRVEDVDNEKCCIGIREELDVGKERASHLCPTTTKTMPDLDPDDDDKEEVVRNVRLAQQQMRARFKVLTSLLGWPHLTLQQVLSTDHQSCSSSMAAKVATTAIPTHTAARFKEPAKRLTGDNDSAVAARMRATPAESEMSSMKTHVESLDW